MGHLTRDGHKLVCYAPGDGALAFTWEWERRAESREVTESDVRELLALKRNEHLRTHELRTVNGRLRLVAPVRRRGPDRLLYMGYYGGHPVSTPELEVTYSGNGGWNTVYTACSDGHEIRNLNIIGALSFFLQNESQLNWGT